MSTHTPREFPNLQARLRRFRRLPGTPDLTTMIGIWTDGARFRIQDGTGRRPFHLLGDVLHPQGLGLVPRTIEEFMNVSSKAANSQHVQTNILADLSTDVATVHEPGQTPWTMPAAVLVPVVEQLFLPADTNSWRPAGTGTALGRATQVFESDTTGEED